MKEIEVKILEIDKGRVVNKLENLKAIKIFDGEMNSFFFDTKENSLLNSGKMLRIRQKGDKYFITLKIDNKDKEVKVNDEFEIKIENFEEMRNLLKGLGFVERLKDLRHRISYKIKNSLVEIDIFKSHKIPSFLEIESPDKKELIEMVKILGYEMKDARNWNLDQVLEYYNLNKKL